MLRHVGDAVAENCASRISSRRDSNLKEIIFSLSKFYLTNVRFPENLTQWYIIELFIDFEMKIIFY